VPRPKSPDPKTDALRSVGALNPHPAAVKDEIFAGSDFFDRRDLVQVRYEMVRVCAPTADPSPRQQRASACPGPPTTSSVPSSSARASVAFCQEARPKGGHKLRAEVVEALRAARTQDPAVDAASLVELVKRRFGVEIHARTIERALKKKRS